VRRRRSRDLENLAPVNRVERVRDAWAVILPELCACGHRFEPSLLGAIHDLGPGRLSRCRAQTSPEGPYVIDPDVCLELGVRVAREMPREFGRCCRGCNLSCLDPDVP
jgi:hypothetical protein